MTRLTLTLVLLALSGCSGGSAPKSDNPMCQAACEGEEHRLPDAGAECDADSKRSCIDQCEARVADASNLCAACLTDDASLRIIDGCYVEVTLDGDTDSGSSSCRDGQTCEMSGGWSGERGTCTFVQGDDDGYDACYVELCPRRPVPCESFFPDVTACASVCADE